MTDEKAPKESAVADAKEEAALKDAASKSVNPPTIADVVADTVAGTSGPEPVHKDTRAAASAVAKVDGGLDDDKAPLPPDSKSPTSEAQRAGFAAKVAHDAVHTELAQKATHEEHIDHVLTRGNPMEPQHSAVGAAHLVGGHHAAHAPKLPPEFRVRLAFNAGGRGEEGTGAETESPPPHRAKLKPSRLLAQYDTPAEVLHAAETLRDAGYKSFEAHSPFPVHGMDTAMGLPDSKLGWIVLLCGLTGVSSAWLLMYWTNGIDYPLIVGGKPPGALPSMVPIMFELTVLLSAFGAVFGMFGLNRLPQHHDPIFYSDRFAAFSNDKFFISVESVDPKFNVDTTCKLLEKTKPQTIEVIETSDEVGS